MVTAQKKHQKMCEKLLGQTIEEVEVNYTESCITLYTDKGLIEFSGDGLQMYTEENLKQ